MRDDDTCCVIIYIRIVSIITTTVLPVLTFSGIAGVEEYDTELEVVRDIAGRDARLEASIGGSMPTLSDPSLGEPGSGLRMLAWLGIHGRCA